MNCPKCGSSKVTKYGKMFSKTRGNMQRYKCNNCGYVFALSEKEVK
jgi:transposase-like protein